MRTVLPSEAVLSKPESSKSLTSEARGWRVSAGLEHKELSRLTSVVLLDIRVGRRQMLASFEVRLSRGRQVSASLLLDVMQ